MSVVSTPAVLLRSFDYGETSKVLKFYSRELGLVSVMAKGIRRGGARGQAGPDIFSRGELTAYVRPTRDLQTFKEFALEEAGEALGKDVIRFAGASVLAEIVLLHAAPDPSPEVFERLTHALRRIEAESPASLVGAVLAEGWVLVTTLGYEPQIEGCVQCGRLLEPSEVSRFDLAAGGTRCPDCASDHSGPLVGPGARQQIRALLQGTIPEPLGKPKAHLHLLHDFVTYHISGSKPLKAFRIFVSLAGLDT
jgi:DNA repair protein RecO (recombination protein O)